ncbi:MAG: hypothetical protein ACKO2L_09580 [Planctomycetaceae bacterium]
MPPRATVLFFRIVLDLEQSVHSVLFFDADRRLIDRIHTSDISVIRSLTSFLRYESPLYWDMDRQWLVTAEFEPVGEGGELAIAPDSSGTRPEQIGSVAETNIPEDLWKAQSFDLQKLVEQERHAFPENSDRYRHISQYKVRFDFAGGRHHIFLYLDGDLKGRICTSDNNLFDFLFDVLRNGNRTLLYDHYTGVIVTQLESVGGVLSRQDS